MKFAKVLAYLAFSLTPVLIFNLTIADASDSCSTPSFKSAPVYSVGADPRSVAAGDFNGDNKSDIVTANFDSNDVSVLLNDATGVFSKATSFKVGANPYSVAVGDFNGDGRPDIVSANNASNNVSILLGDGAGGFGTASNFNAGSSPRHVTVADFNGDSRSDLAVANEGSNNISILSGNGAGGFGAPVNYAVGQQPRFLTAADFNNDGKTDLAVSIIGSFRILLGNGAGGFVSSCTGVSSDVLAVGDFNGDGKIDLAAVSVLSDSVSVLLGDGAGCFGPATSLKASSHVGYHTLSVAVSNFNGDGKADLIVSTDSAGSSILLGDGAGGFSPPTTFGTSGSRYLAIADFNGDAKIDSVMVTDHNTVTILFGDGAGGFDLTFDWEATSVAAGDFNRDGKPDLAVTNGRGVSILLGDGMGGFGRPANFQTPQGPTSVTTGDFNKDGKLDVAVATSGVTNQGTVNVSVLLGDGAGGLSAPANFPVGSSPYSIVTGDFNGDGNPDLVTAHQLHENITVLLGNGAGGFSAGTSYPAKAATNPQSIGMGDFNNDGKLDLAVPSNSGVSILSGDGSGGFGTVKTVSDGVPSMSVAVGDLNGDSKLDLATANPNFNANSVAILFGDGVGGFSVPLNYSVGGIPRTVKMGDFNGDSKLDLATANSIFNSAGPSNVAILLNDGSGGFGAATNYLVSATPRAIATGDFNNDSGLDLVTANGAGNASLLLNNCKAMPPTEPTASILLNTASYTVEEANGQVNVTVNRTGDTSGTATIDYATSDTFPISQTCQAANTGVASSRCDYTTTIGTLQFAAGESSKTIFIPIVDDNTWEGNENFTITLSNPSGASLGSISTATVTITDNEPPPTSLQLILDESGPGSNQVAAIDSLLFLRDPFPVVNEAHWWNQGADKNTRVILFTNNLQLRQGEAASSIIVNLVDVNNQSYEIGAEDVRSVPNFNFTQVIFRLPDNLAPGTYTIKVKAHNQESNSGTIRIRS